MCIFNYGNLVDPLLSDVRRFTPTFSGMNPEDRVLDVCCGTGAQVLEYGRRGIIATGIDISPSMLNIASRNKARQNLDNIYFQLADAANLPFADRCFDYASISFGLHDKERGERCRIVAEMKRVIKQDGALVFIDFQVPPPNNIWALVARAIEFMGDHYQSFQDYLQSGGLEDILKVHHLHEDHRSCLKLGLAVIVKAKIA